MPFGTGRTSTYTTLIMLSALLATSTGVHVVNITVPDFAVSGSTVQLTCNYEQRSDRPDPVYSVKWYRDADEFYEYAPKNTPPERAFPVSHLKVDKEKSHKTSVVLTGLQKESSGTYRCEVMGDMPHFETDDQALNMTVLDVPRWGPEIEGLSQGDRVLPGDTIKAVCLVGSSDPPADILWLLNSRDFPYREQVMIAFNSRHGEDDTQTSELKFEVTEESFTRGALTLTCQVNLFDVFHKSANVTLVHALQPQPAEFGWFSRGSSTHSAKLLSTVMLLLYISIS